VIDLIKGIRERIYPVGRLDRNTTGLLLLTNDGDLAQKLSHPSSEIKKVYEVELVNPVTEDDLDKIRKGITLEDGVAEVDWINHKYEGELNKVVLELHQGKNRVIRRIFEQLGNEVKSLDRTYYAGLNKKDLARGRYRFLTGREITMLKHFI
jgi:23S rRNA pseudouridine2605 synthase